MGIFDSFKSALSSKLKSVEKMEEEAAINAIVRQGMLGARMFNMGQMEDEDFLMWSAQWCQTALPFLRMKGNPQSFEKVLMFLLNFEECYYPLKLRVERFRIRDGDEKGQIRLEEGSKGEIACPFSLYSSYQKIEFRMITDAKLLLGLSFDPEDVKPNTVIMNKPEIPVPYYGIKDTASMIPDKPSDKKIAPRLKEDIEEE